MNRPNILDPRFKYTPAAATDIRKTWARATKHAGAHVNASVQQQQMGNDSVPLHKAKFFQEAAYNNAERANRYYCLLKDEYHLRTQSSSPWECESDTCPRVGKLADKNCGCFADRYAQHMRQIAALPGEAE